MLTLTLVNSWKYSQCIQETFWKRDILQEVYQKSENINLLFVSEPNLKKCQELLLRLPNMQRSFFL